MSSKSSHKKPPTAQDLKKDLQQQQQQTDVKLRRKESTTNKNPQPDNQRKSVMFRFLHRDKKKNPELPEHGFIPDARRILEGPSKSLTVSQGNTVSDVRNRWSSYEPVDFSQLSSSSCNKTEDKKQTTITIDDNTTKRSISHESMPPTILTPPPPSVRVQNEPSLQPQPTDISLAERIKKIDEKLHAALSDRRRILEKLLQTPSKFFNGSPGLKPLLFNSFISSETITKLASNSMNSPGNVVTSEDIKNLKQNILELQKNLTLISDMICSNSKDKSSLLSTSSSSSSSLSRDSIVDGTTLADQKIPPTHINIFADVDGTVAVTPLLPDNNEIQEVLTKIDEENENTATNENLSSHFVPLISSVDVHPPIDVSLACIQHFCEDDSQSHSQNDPLKFNFRKEKMIPIIHKSSSTSCFPELRIHSSIAEEDEDVMTNEDAICDDQSMDDVCLEPPRVVDVVPENIKESDVECLQLEESGNKNEFNIENVIGGDTIGESPSEESHDNDANENALDDKIRTLSTNNPFSDVINNEVICKDELIENIILKEATAEEDLSIIEAIAQDSVINNIGSSMDEDFVINKKELDEPTVELTMMSCPTNESSVHVHTDMSIYNDAFRIYDDIMEIKNGDDNDVHVGDENNCEVDNHFQSSDDGNQVDQSDINDANKFMKGEVHDISYGDVVQEDSKKVEVCMTLEEGECVGSFPFEEVVTITETPDMEMADDLKVENVEVLICGDERMDSLGSVCDEDDASDKSTPVNSDTCEANNGGSNEGSDGTINSHQVSLPSNKTAGNNRNKKRNKRKRKSHQQQTNNSHEKTSSDSKNISDNNSEASR